MNKLPLHTPNLVDKNIQAIAALFPSTLTERIAGYTESGEAIIEYAIDFDALKQELSAVVVEGAEERYQFTWPDKKKSVLLANAPNFKTLRPCREESVNFDATENLYIEGDNLDVLKLLQETYLGQVKMIYIDPPYNTGKDFVYADDFAMESEEWRAESGDFDEDGNRLFVNSETNGRYHTDWLNMMYPRLRLAKDLLRDDGVIFISIDDNEVQNLRKICDEVFGAWNFAAQCVRKRRDSQANLSKSISPIHEYVLIYLKSSNGELNRIAANIDTADYKNPDNDPRGPYVTMPCTNRGGAMYEIETPTKVKITDEWRFKEETYYKLKEDNRLIFPKGGDGKPRYKIFLSEKREQGVLANTWWDSISSNQEATREIKGCFGAVVFDTPKPVEMIKHCLRLASDKDSIILDFFSGSATTAHAVMQLNAEDGGNRKFIMVQLPEIIDEKHEAYKAGYRTITDIGKERIRRAGEKIQSEVLRVKSGVGQKNSTLHTPHSTLDTGFRVLKVDSTNMKDVYYFPEKYIQGQLDMFVDNIKEDRTPEDLLFQVMLDLGVFLSCRIEVESIGGKDVFVVYQGDIPYLTACFDSGITGEVVTAIAKRQPYYAVFRDGGMESDSLLTSFGQIFEAYSKKTIRKVL